MLARFSNLLTAGVRSTGLDVQSLLQLVQTEGAIESSVQVDASEAGTRKEHNEEYNQEYNEESIGSKDSTSTAQSESNMWSAIFSPLQHPTTQSLEAVAEAQRFLDKEIVLLQSVLDGRALLHHLESSYYAALGTELNTTAVDV